MAGAGVAGCRQTLPPASRPWISGLRACVLLWFCAPPSPVSVTSLKGPRSPALHQPVGHPSLDHTPVSRDPVIILPLGEAKVGRLFRILLWIVLNLGHLGRGLCPAVLVDNLTLKYGGRGRPQVGLGSEPLRLRPGSQACGCGHGAEVFQPQLGVRSPTPFPWKERGCQGHDGFSW